MPSEKENTIERGFKQIACELLDISTRSYSNFVKQKRPIIKLLEKYFTKEDLQEFIDNGKIHKLENTNYIQNYFLKSKLNNYINIFDSIEFIYNDDVVSDFYFYFLSNLKNNNLSSKLDFLTNSNYIENNYFIESLSSYISQIQSDKFNINIFPKESEETKHEYITLIQNNLQMESSNKSSKEIIQNYIHETIKVSETNLNTIFNNLSFIQNWDNDMMFFIDYLIQSDFELFINSNNHELLYHAIGYLVYSNMQFNEKDILYNRKIDIVNYIYEYFIDNKSDINKELIKEISFNFESFFNFKNYKEISEYFKNTKRESSKEEIYKIISSPKKYNELLKEMKQYELNNS